jgi:AcrR family transcriptional regulator
MKETSTRNTIILCTIPLLARNGYEGTSMRAIANAAQVEQSLLYYHFVDKAALLRAVRQHLNTQLDESLQALSPVQSTAELLRQRLRFQIEQREAIVCLLQYFMAVKQDFPRQAGGYVPERAYQHMRDIVDAGLAEGCYKSADPNFDAKILTHLVNGFLIEYYPNDMPAKEVATLTEQLAQFIERALGA